MAQLLIEQAALQAVPLLARVKPPEQVAHVELVAQVAQFETVERQSWVQVWALADSVVKLWQVAQVIEVAQVWQYSMLQRARVQVPLERK